MVQPLTLATICERSAVWLALGFGHAVHHRAESSAAVLGPTGVASIIERSAVLGRRAFVRACALHAILVVGAVSRALGRAVHLSASAEHAVVGQALVASLNVRVNVCVCVCVCVCARMNSGP